MELSEMRKALVLKFSRPEIWTAIGAALVGWGVLDQQKWSLILGIILALLGGVGLSAQPSQQPESTPAPAPAPPQAQADTTQPPASP